jgi:putative toxin-antitoxin system antitoxin component (TIGR02293 family)
VLLLDSDPLLPCALGISRRTLERWRNAPGGMPLNREQSSRAWVLAKKMVQAIGVLGSQNEAEEWLRRPVPGLSGRRPIELVTTPMGVKLVADHLVRVEYGVYT